jgi:hypothetical protein
MQALQVSREPLVQLFACPAIPGWGMMKKTRFSAEIG